MIMAMLNSIISSIVDFFVYCQHMSGCGLYMTYFYGIYALDSINWSAFFPGSITYRRVVKTRLNMGQYGGSLSSLAEWAIKEATNSDSKSNKNTNQSCHWWVGELPVQLQLVIDSCSWNSSIKNMFETIFYPSEYSIMEIPQMNELYITGEDNEKYTNSDRVFYMSHIDGPFGWIPFVSVYRCLIGCSNENTIMTRFVFHNTDTMIQQGDVLGFDFNREIHYIKDVRIKRKTTNINEADSKSTHKYNNRRIVLKTHYCIYPKSMQFFASLVASLNTLYNSHFRHMFVHTMCPRTMIDYIHSSLVVYSSYMYVCTDIFIGHKNILYLLFVNILVSCESRFLFYALPVIYKIIQLFIIKSKYIEGGPFLRDLFLFYVISIVSGNEYVYEEIGNLSSDSTISTADGPLLFG